MAVVDHLKTASGEILKATELVKQEIETLRKDHQVHQREREVLIAQRLDNVRQLEHDQQKTDNDDLTRQLQGQLQNVIRQVAELRKEMADNERAVENAIREKTGLLESLEAKARSIMP